MCQDRLAGRVVDLGLGEAQEQIGSGESKEGRRRELIDGLQ